MYARRWGDNDRHLGPILFARDRSYKHLALLISSGHDEDAGCRLRFSCYGFTIIVGLPQIIKPHVSWVDLSNHEWATPGRDGRKGYTQIDEREYGFSVHEGHLSVSLGRKTNDSSTEQRWGCFLPWTQWRFVRQSRYDLEGKPFWTEQAADRLGKGIDTYRASREAKERCPSASFEFEDFDGERLQAKTTIDEAEWKFGEGCFKWLSLFRRAKVRRSLDIEFSGETGQRKGSWKGGTIGHSIEMLPGELHEAAFRRYCAEHDMTFVGSAEV
ncbi:hypothetical protein GOC31_16355 [Sinorhizobium meliloti]|nr:hypothetical protein [Sinorhizobium meliloti]